MTTSSSHQITELLLAWSNGDQAALEKLTPLVYEELRRRAHRYMARERRGRPGHTLQTGDLAHDAFLRLVDVKRVQWQGREHFYKVAARMMRRILVEDARRRKRQKRGGKALRVSFNEEIDEEFGISDERAVDLLALDDALTELAAWALRKSQIVELRFFGGFTVEETAEALEVSPDTVRREWKKARAWLYCKISGSETDDT